MNRRKNGKLILLVLGAIVTLGIGYAAITGINLLINGRATVKSSGGDFKVRFVKNDASETAIDDPVNNAIVISGVNADSSPMNIDGITASVEDDTHAKFAAGELDEVGEYVDFTYTVVNESNHIDAMLSFDIDDENDGEEYFEVTKTVDKSIISESEIAHVKVRVKLINRPRLNDYKASFTVTLSANPIEEEDTSSSISGSTGNVTSPTTLAKAIQNDSVDTIELNNDITIDKKTSLNIDDDTTIDFNGHTLTVEPGTIKVSDGATLTLTDDSKMGGIKSSNNAVIVQDNSEVIVESGSYETTNFTGRGAVITIPKGTNNAKITVNGGTINGDYFAISSYGNGEIEINGGEIISTATVKNGADETGRTYHAYTVKLNSGHLTMNGGSITGIHGGIALEGTSSATIKGGSVTLNNSSEGAKDSYYCLYVNGSSSAEVTNTTCVNNGTNALVYSSSTGLVNLKGGTWTGKNAKAFNGTPNAGKDSIKVYGGTYKKNTNGTLTDYDVSGYKVN